VLVSTPSLRPLSVFCSTAFANFQSTSKYRFPARVPEIAKSCVGSIRQHLAAKHPNALFRLSDARAPVVVCSPPRIGHVIIVQMATAPRSGAVFMFRCCCAMLLRCRCDAAAMPTSPLARSLQTTTRKSAAGSTLPFSQGTLQLLLLLPALVASTAALMPGDPHKLCVFLFFFKFNHADHNCLAFEIIVTRTRFA